MIFQIHGKWLCNNISQFTQNPRMHVIRPHRLVAIQFHQVVPNLLLAYSRRDLALPTPTMRCGRTWLLVKSEAKNSLSNSVFSISVVTGSPLSFIGEYTFLGLSFLTLYIYRIAFCYFSHRSPSPIPSVLWLSWSHPYTSEQYPCTLPRSPVFCFHWLRISFLLLILRTRSLLIYAGICPAFLDFLHIGMESFVL